MLHKIKELCKEQGLTIGKLETDLKLGKNTITRWDVVMPSADKLNKVAKKLNTTVEDLLEEEHGINRS